MENVINFDLIKEYDTALKDILEVWTKQKTYSLGDKVKYKGHLLECTIAGTSGTTTLNFTGLDIGDTITDGTVVWELVEQPSGKGIDFYTVGESYNVGDIVIYNGNIYQCITTHTSTSTFDTTKWEEVSKSRIPYYNQDISYEVDDQVVYDNKIYRCITAHTSTAIFDTTKWAEISAGDGGIDLPEWQANTAYTAGKYLVYEGTVYKVTTNFTSSTEFDGTNLEVYIAPNYNIYSTTEQELGTWIDSKKLYRRTFNNPTDGLSTGLTSSLVSIKRIYGHCIQENEWQFDIPFYEPNGGIALYIDVLTGILSIDCYGNYMSGCVFPYVTVEYTKN